MITQTYYNVVLFVDEKENNFHFGLIEYAQLPEIWKLGEIYKTNGEYHTFFSFPDISTHYNTLVMQDHLKKQLDKIIFQIKEKLINYASKELSTKTRNLNLLYRRELDKNQ